MRCFFCEWSFSWPQLSHLVAASVSSPARRDRFSVSRKGSSGALTEGGVDSPASRVLPRVAGRQQTYMQFDLFFLLCRPVEGNPLGLLAHPPPSGVSSRLLRTWRAESASFRHTFVHNCCARMGWVLASYVVFFDVFRSFAILFCAFSDDLAISWYMFFRLLGWTYCFDLSLLVGARSASDEAVVCLHCVL